MAGKIVIRYFNRRGEYIDEQETDDPYTAEEVTNWEAWLNDPNVEQYCVFDQFEILER
jgi:hypothetical protein